MGQDRVQGACLASTYTAIQLTIKVNQRIQILYQNPHMCSSYGCRPLKLWFVHESTENAKQEINRLKAEAENLVPFVSDSGLKVNFLVFFSMCDQKIENLKWDNFCSMRCPFCRFLQSCFHEDLLFIVDVHAIGDCCISDLHFLLRVFDHFLKVILPPIFSYNSSFFSRAERSEARPHLCAKLSVAKAR